MHQYHKLKILYQMKKKLYEKRISKGIEVIRKIDRTSLARLRRALEQLIAKDRITHESTFRSTLQLLIEEKGLRTALWQNRKEL